MGLGQQCQDLRQAGAFAASGEQARRKAQNLRGESPPRLRGLVPKWYLPASSSPQEAAREPLKGKAFLSLFGGVAEGARLFAEQGDVAGVVDFEDSTRNDLSRMSSWNSILHKLDSFMP